MSFEESSYGYSVNTNVEVLNTTTELHVAVRRRPIWDH
jgi:hypothetical protein